MDSSDEEEPERSVLPFCRPHLKFVDGDYKHDKITEPEPQRRRKKARRRVNPFIKSEARVDWNASGDDGTDDENDDLNKFIVVDDFGF